MVLGANMSDHKRTMIRRLSVRGYRSLREVDLDDLPPVVVLYGPNGSGKSNILHAVRFILRAAMEPGDLPATAAGATTLSLPDVESRLDLRADDFTVGATPEIRVSLEIEIGSRAIDIVRAPAGRTLSRLHLGCVVQMASASTVRVWFERADVDGALRLGPSDDPKERGVRAQLDQIRAAHNQLEASRAVQQQQLATLEAQPPSAQVEAQRHAARAHIQQSTTQLKAHEERVKQLETSLGADALLAERIHRVLLPRLLQVSEAYRVPGGPGDPQAALYRAFLSEDQLERAAAQRLGRRLGAVGLFGVARDEVALFPVESQTYGERQIRFRHPVHGELPLRNLGTGEQQLVLLLGNRVITPYPIAHIEEPEAHLHTQLMGPFARGLRDSVLADGGPPDVDQLWMATHHHLFAIHEEYLDVSLDDRGATRVERRKREAAARHFYEPGPYWDTLRALVQCGMSADTVVSRNAEGQPIRARDVLASIEGDRRLADEFVRAATKAFTLSLVEEGPDK
jgi:energy-coupling factor transporter ATP-binding protein EcfA2